MVPCSEVRTAMSKSCQEEWFDTASDVHQPMMLVRTVNGLFPTSESIEPNKNQRNAPLRTIESVFSASNLFWRIESLYTIGDTKGHTWKIRKNFGSIGSWVGNNRLGRRGKVAFRSVESSVIPTRSFQSLKPERNQR